MPIASPTLRDITTSPYRLVLGERFESLGEVLRAFHADGGCARGRFDVVVGNGLLRGGLARLFRLPRPGASQPVTLEVTTRGALQVWRRTIGQCRFHSTQWASGEALIERVGPFRFRFRLASLDGSLRFEQQGATFLGIPLPRFATPLVTATARATSATAWTVRVEIACSPFGIITSYAGSMELT